MRCSSSLQCRAFECKISQPRKMAHCGGRLPGKACSHDGIIITLRAVKNCSTGYTPGLPAVNLPTDSQPFMKHGQRGQ